MYVETTLLISSLPKLEQSNWTHSFKECSHLYLEAYKHTIDYRPDTCICMAINE